MKIEKIIPDNQQDSAEDHFSSNANTPLRDDAFFKTDEEKILIIQKHVHSILETLGMDLTDDSIKGTPKRVAKAYVKEIFGGLHPDRKPKSSTFNNSYKYGEMLVEKNIVVYSTCEHHLLPIIGRAHIAYISKGTVVGLSKMNRIVDYYARRPQVQERLTHQVANSIKYALNPKGVAVVMEGRHMCMQMRGVEKQNSFTSTSAMFGQFKKST